MNLKPKCCEQSSTSRVLQAVPAASSSSSLFKSLVEQLVLDGPLSGPLGGPLATTGLSPQQWPPLLELMRCSPPSERTWESQSALPIREQRRCRQGKHDCRINPGNPAARKGSFRCFLLQVVAALDKCPAIRPILGLHENVVTGRHKPRRASKGPSCLSEGGNP